MDASGDASYGVETSIDPKVRHKILRSAMVFTRTEGLLTKGKPVVSVTYKCESGQPCNFASVFNAVEASQDLLAWGVSPMLSEIIGDIKDNQDAYHPARFDGFMINRDGNNLVHFTRGGSKGDGRTGFIEYNNYRHSMVEEARTSRIIAAVKFSARGSEKCAIM